MEATTPLCASRLCCCYSQPTEASQACVNVRMSRQAWCFMMSLGMKHKKCSGRPLDVLKVPQGDLLMSCSTQPGPV